MENENDFFLVKKESKLVIEFLQKNLKKHFDFSVHDYTSYMKFSKREFNNLNEVRKNLPKGLNLASIVKIDAPKNLPYKLSSLDLFYVKPSQSLPHERYYVGFVKVKDNLNL